MRRPCHLLALALAGLLVASFIRSAAALSTAPDKPQNISISMGAEYASGKYGTNTRTSSIYLPFVAVWSPDERFDVGIEIPILYQSNTNVTTDLYRESQQETAVAKSAAKGRSGGYGTGLRQGAGGPGGAAATGAAPSSVTGLADVILRVGVIALAEGESSPQIRPSLFVKFPTASKTDGLGTGEFDAGAGIEMNKWYGDLHLVGEGSFTYQGKAEGFGLKNYFSYTGGIGYQTSDLLQPMLLVKGATAPSDFLSDELEVRARIIWSLTSSTALDLYASRGLTDSSPDYGGGIAVIYSF